MTIVVPVDDPTAIDRAAEALDRGEIVVVPTDTVYGLAARADAPRAADALFELKGRPADVPLAVLVADRGQAEALVTELARWATELVDRHWPGPLTIVATRRPGLDLDLGEPDGTIGVRCPDHPALRALAGRVGALATTSANRHGLPTPATLAEVIDQLADGLGSRALALDGGPCTGSPSTVVDVTGDQPVILRPGLVDPFEGWTADGS